MFFPRRIAATFAALAALACASSAAADGGSSGASASSATRAGAGSRSGIGLVDEAERWLTAATAGPTVASEPADHGNAKASTTAERAAPTTEVDRAFVDFSPFASVVARDWHGAVKVVGDRTMLVDDLRPTASNRMVMGRLATDARLSLFAQAGVGEWRIDPAMFPNARSYSEMAGQVGVGFDLRLPRNLRVASEAQYTMLYRDLHYTADEVAPRILAFVVAIDGRF